MTLREILTPRQFQVARMISEGLVPKEIATSLSIETNTVKAHLQVITGKVRLNRVQLAVRFALEERDSFGN